MINYDKVSLPVCAFGASLGHIAALALIVPVVITLPAPGETVLPRAVAIHVEVRRTPPAPPEVDPIAALTASSDVVMGKAPPAPSPGVADEVAAPESLEASDEPPDDVTGALPVTVLTETPDAAADLPEAPSTERLVREEAAPTEVIPVLTETPDAATDLPETPSTERLVQEESAPTEVIPSTVAAIHPDGPWSDVPIPARKPQRIFEADAPRAEQAAPAATPRAAPPAANSRAVRSRPAVKKRLFGGQPPIGTFDYPVPGRLPGSG